MTNVQLMVLIGCIYVLKDMSPGASMIIGLILLIASALAKGFA